MVAKNIFKNYILPTATLSGAIIGVGFFSLPYITLKVGTWQIFLYFIVLVPLVVFIHLIFGEVALLTPDFKRFPGFVKFHLGKLFGSLYLVSTVLGSFGVLLVYLIIGSDFLKNISGGSQLVCAFVFWGLISFVIFFGIRIISKIELGVMAFIFFILSLIFINGFLKIKLDNFFISNPKLQFSNIFLPYGPIVFSLWGMGVIPEIEEMLGKNKTNIKKIIAVSFLIVSVVYLFFIFLTLGIAGSNTTETALTGFKNYLNPVVFFFSLFLGVVTTFTASVMLGLTLKKIFIYDLGVKKIKAWLITCLVPLILFLLGLNSFIGLISFVGGVLLGLDGILILLMYKKLRGRKIIVYPLMAIFLSGIIYEITRFLY